LPSSKRAEGGARTTKERKASDRMVEKAVVTDVRGIPEGLAVGPALRGRTRSDKEATTKEKEKKEGFKRGHCGNNRIDRRWAFKRGKFCAW